MPVRDLSLSRRDALRAGGLAVLGAGVLAACSDDEPVAVTGTTGPEQTTTTLPSLDDDDLVFLRTAASLELSAASFYEQVLEGDRQPGADLREVAVLFQTHHQQHAELVDGPLAAADDDEQVLEAALALEELATDAYVAAGGTLSRSDLREKAMQIGGSDARHVAYLEILLEIETVPEAFAPAEPLEGDALLEPGELTSTEDDADTEDDAAEE